MRPRTTDSQRAMARLRTKHIGPPDWEHTPVPNQEPRADCWIRPGHPDLREREVEWSTTRGRNMGRPRWICETFWGPIADGIHVAHKCDIPACFNPKHLEYKSPGDNQRDAYQRLRKTYPIGESHGRAKITEEDVRFIRHLRTHKRLLSEEIEKLFPMGASSIRHIATFRNWKHVLKVQPKDCEYCQQEEV